MLFLKLDTLLFQPFQVLLPQLKKVLLWDVNLQNLTWYPTRWQVLANTHLVFAVLFFHNPLTVSLAIISANIPDFDHDVKKENVYRLIILGLVLFIVLYFLKLPCFIGLILVYFGITFYFSEHRSFTHSLFAVFIFPILIFFIFKTSYYVFHFDYIYLILIVLFSLIFLNKKIVIPFIVLLFLSSFIFDLTMISSIEILFYLSLGYFSHIVLDSFTPSGVKLFAPLSSKTFHKNFGIVCCILILILAVLHIAFNIFNPALNSKILLILNNNLISCLF